MTAATRASDGWDMAPDAGWLRHGRLAGLTLIGGGAVLVLGACIGVQRADYLLNELAYIATGGITGLFCAVVGGACVAATELAQSRRRLEFLEKRRSAAPDEAPPSDADAVIGAVVDIADRAGPKVTVRR